MFGRTCYRAFDLRQGSLRSVRGLRTEQVEIDAATAARDNAKLPKFDNSMAVLRLDPRGAINSRASVDAVPTATEIDWSGLTVPCTAAIAKAEGKGSKTPLPNHFLACSLRGKLGDY